MLVFLPEKANELATLISDLMYDYFDILKKLQPTEVTASLPRFSFDFTEDMVRHLEQVNHGVNDWFYAYFY